jgi:hypothetical protein
MSYRGTAPALTDLIAGHILTMFGPISRRAAGARGADPHAAVSMARARARRPTCRRWRSRISRIHMVS